MQNIALLGVKIVLWTIVENFIFGIFLSFKETEDVISSYPLFTAWHVRFTTVTFNTLFDFGRQRYSFFIAENWVQRLYNVNRTVHTCLVSYKNVFKNPNQAYKIHLFCFNSKPSFYRQSMFKDSYHTGPYLCI